MDFRRIAVLSVITLAWACGGQSLAAPDDGEGGTGGAGTGGTSAGGTTGGTGVGGTTGGTGVGGTGATTGGTGVGGTGATTGGTGVGGTGVGGTAAAGSGGVGGSCLAFPACADGQIQVPGPEYCVAGAPCEQHSICGTTIWCTVEATCDAIPVCDAEDMLVMGPCPPDDSCYTQSVCGTTIWCLDRCNPDTEHNREYLLKECAPGDGWLCPANTQSFVNECGCGCEQDPNCPPTFYCQRAPVPDEAARELPADGGAGTGSGAAPLPFCDAAELARCPYSEPLF
jgi:hypothetical protein